MKSKKLSLEYIAGFVDGEGCISIHENRAWLAESANGRPRIVMQVAIANCNRAVLVQIQRQHGGSICKQTRTNPHARQGYALKLSEQSACRFLEKILPFLCIKRKQAKLMLQLGKRKAKDVTYLSVHESVIRRRIAERCQALNKKGPR
jgi:hypothetical protein